jgi:hypothetical protein
MRRDRSTIACRSSQIELEGSIPVHFLQNSASLLEFRLIYAGHVEEITAPRRHDLGHAALEAEAPQILVVGVRVAFVRDANAALRGVNMCGGGAWSTMDTCTEITRRYVAMITARRR